MLLILLLTMFVFFFKCPNIDKGCRDINVQRNRIWTQRCKRLAIAL